MIRYYAVAAVTMISKKQKLLIVVFADTVFCKNSVVRGVNREEPLDYVRTMFVAKAVLTKHDHSSRPWKTSSILIPTPVVWRREGRRMR